MEPLEQRRLLAGELVITEFQASNGSTLQDEDGDTSDWIEVYNRSNQNVDLNGWYLTDNADDLEKWRFPAFSLAAGDSLLVFASGKNRLDPAASFHTDFELSSAGEYLALVEPDGATIANEFAPAFPQQFRDISYGVGTSVSSATLLPEGAAAEILIPQNGSLGTSWTEVDFTTDSTWIREASSGIPATTGVGFDNETAVPTLQAHWPLNDAPGTSGNGSVEEVTGVGHNGTPTGGVSFGMDGANDYTDLGASFNSASIDVPYSAALNPASFTFTAWVYPRSTAGYQSVVTSRLDTLPNLFGFVLYNDSSGQWAFWTGSGPGAGGWSVLGGPAVATNTWSHMAISFDAATNAKTLWINGNVAATTANQRYAPNTLRELHIGGGGDFGTQYPFNGIIDDAALFSEALDQASIQNIMNTGVPDSAATNFGELIETDLTTAMTDVNATAYVRSEFQVADPSPFQQLRLNMKYDDGFVAYLNGAPIASRNAPATVDWNSPATAAHPDSLGVQGEQIEITASIPLLQAGTNVLAIQGLNVSAADGDFLVLPEIVAISEITIDLAEGYFDEPTPGQLNGSPLMIGPQVTDVAHSPQVPAAGEALTVTAALTERLAPIEEVSLVYRAMYGAEITLPMLDDGAGADQIAGDQVFTALIPGGAAASGQMIRYYVTAQDDQGHSTRQPANLDLVGTKQSPEYFGTVVQNSSLPSTPPVFQWFTQNTSAAHARGGTRGSVFYAGRFYDNVFVRQRGGFTNAAVSQKFVFNRNHEFLLNEKVGEVEEINVNGPGSDGSYLRQPLAYTAHQVADGASSESFVMHMSVNGSFDRIGILIEQVDEDFLDRNGFDPDGDLYKFVQRSNLNPAFNDSSTGVEKKTGDVLDFSSIDALIAGLKQGSSLQKQNFIRDALDIPQILNYLAVRTVQQQADDVRKNFYMYFDAFGDQRWRMFPWDLDWTFEIVGGHGQERTEHPYFGTQDFPTADGNNQWNVMYDVLLETPEVRQMFMRRIRTLMDEFYGGQPGSPGVTWFADQANIEFAKIDPFLNSNVTSAKNSLLNSIENRRRDLYAEYTFSIPGVADRIPAAQVGNPTIDFGEIEFNPASGNQDEEYIELRNPHPFAVDLSGWTLQGGVEHTLAPGTVIPAGGALYLSPDVSAFRERTSGPAGGMGLYVQGGYRGHLSNFGETLTLRGADGELVSATSYVGDPSPAQQFLRITELHYNPAAPTTEELAVDPNLDNEDFEFIELTNIGPEPLELGGVHFSNGIQFEFPAGLLASGETVLVVHDLQAFQLRYGTGLNVAGAFSSGSLNNAGESVKLEDEVNGTIHEFDYDDSADWPTAADGRGASLQVIDTEADYDAAGNWRASVEYGGSPGLPGMAPVADVVINEVLSHTDPPQVDAIELYNTSTSAVDISGWYLSDTSDEYRKFQVPAGTILAPRDYVVFDETEFNASMGVDPDDFALNSAHGDDVWLLASDASGALTRFVDHVEFGAQANGESWGRWPNGSGRPYPQQAPSLDDENTGPRVGPVVISEIMYHAPDPDGPLGLDPDNLEFLEIWNSGLSPVDLTNWRIEGGIEFAFPNDLEIAAQQALAIVPFDPQAALNAELAAEFRNYYALEQNLLLIGGYSRKLGNEGDEARLLRPDMPPADEPDFLPLLLEDEVRFDDKLPWPFGPDGGGDSLSRIQASLWGNQAASWAAQIPSPGVVEAGSLRVNSLVVNGGLLDPEPLTMDAPTSWELQRSRVDRIVVTFNRYVDLAAEHVLLTNLGVNAPSDPDIEIPLSAANVTVNANQLIIDVADENPADGVLRLEISAAVADPWGNALDGDADGAAGDAFVQAGDEDNRFFQLAGNWNGDTGVTIFDFPTFAYWFGQSVPRAPEYVDLNLDGGVTIFDFPLFAGNFGNSVVFPQGVVADGVVGSNPGLPLELSPRQVSRVAQQRAAVEETSVREVREAALAIVLRADSRLDRSAVSSPRWAGEQPELESILEAISEDVLRSRLGGD